VMMVMLVMMMMVTLLMLILMVGQHSLRGKQRQAADGRPLLLTSSALSRR
jgi:hypothetical protein